MKAVLYVVALVALALIGAIDWKMEGWAGHAWTCALMLCAVLALAIAMHDLANS